MFWTPVYNSEYHDITEWLILHCLTYHWPTISLANSSLFPIDEKIQGKGHQLRQPFPEILSSHHCTDRPGPATENILTSLIVSKAKDINFNHQLLNIYFEKIHHTEQPCAHAKRAEKVVLYLYSSSLYSGQDPSAK